MKKEHIELRINNLLNHEINVEIEEVKENLELNPAADVENECLYIGVLYALKKQAQDLIEKL